MHRLRFWPRRKKKGDRSSGTNPPTLTAQAIDSQETNTATINTPPLVTQEQTGKEPARLMSDEELADRTQGLTNGSNGKGLWTEAREKLDPDQLQLLEAFIKDGNEDLGESAKIKLQAIKESRLAIQIGKDKVIPVRDAVKKVIETVLGYNAIITAAVSAEPHASLAWGCVAALLPILSTALSRTDSALDGLHQISVFLVRFRAIEVIYDLSEHPEEKFTTSNSIRNLHAQLRSQTIELYTKVLEYQIDLIDHYSHKQAYRAVSLNSHGDCSEIMKMAANAEKTLQTMDSVAITNVDKQLSSVMEKVKAIMDGMVQIKNNIMDVRMTQRIKELPRATFAAFDEGIEGKVPPPCYGDTRREVLQTIQDWVQDEHGSRVFWLSGMAGTGKSTIARTVAGKFHGQGYLGASFFFLKGQDDRAKTEKFFSTLARGLAETISGFDECIYESIQGSENLHHKSLKHQWESMIFRPLETLESSLLVPLSLVLVIDALDECKGTEAVPAIIRLFLEAKELQRIQLRILVTSRNEKHIIDSLRGEQNVAHLSLEDSPQARTTKRDMSVYIDHELSEIANSKKLRDWPEAKQTQDLLQWSGNLFIAAATVCRFLEKSDFPDDKLKGFLRGNKTTDTEEDTIDYMYRHLLETAADCPDREMFLGHFQAVVGAILVSKEPMSVSEMAKFLGLDTRLITFILKRLGSVLIVPGDSNLAVQIFHLSFRDFILDKNRCKDARFFIHEAQAHKRSSGLCLDLLRTKLKTDICELHHPGAVISEIDQDRITKHISSVLQYCSQYWAFHFTDAGVSSSDHDEFEMVHEFIKEHLLRWLELLALIGRLDDAAHGILNLNAIASGHPRPGLQHFVNDAYRFILSHRSTIEEAPLQTYYMAAVFTPTDSLIREQFSKNYPAWLRKPPIMERHWGSEEQTLGFSSTLLEAFTVSFDGKSVALATNFHTSIWNVNTGNLEHIFRYNHQHESITVKSLMFSRDGSELNVIMGPSKLAKGPVEYALKSWSLITGQAIPASAFTQMQSDWVFLTKLSHWKFRAGRDAVQERQAPKEEEEENPRENERSRRQKEIIARDKMLMVSFSANGAKMALFNRHMVHIGDVETREINRTLAFDNRIMGVALSNTRAIVQFSDSFTVWDLINDRQFQISLGHHVFNRWSLSSDGQKLVYDTNGQLEVRDLDSNRVLHTQKFAHAFKKLALFPRGNKVVVASNASSLLHIWDLEYPSASVTTFSNSFVSLSKNGTNLMISKKDKVPEVWDFMKETIVPDHAKKVGRILDFSSSLGNTVASLKTNSDPRESDESDDEMGRRESTGLQVWSLNTDREDLATKGTFVPTNSTKSSTFAISSSGMRIAFINPTGDVEVWNFSEEDRRWDLCRIKGNYISRAENDRLVVYADFSLDGTRLVICSIHPPYGQGGGIKVWCVENGDTELEASWSYDKSLSSSALSHQPTILAVGIRDQGVELWKNKKNGAQTRATRMRRLTGQRGAPRCMAFSPRNTRIAVGWNEWKIVIFKVDTGETEWAFGAHHTIVRELKFTRDDMWSEEPFYTLDTSLQWILHGQKRVLALPHTFWAEFPDDYGRGYMNGATRHQHAVNSLAFFTRIGRLVTFMFECAPNF